MQFVWVRPTYLFEQSGASIQKSQDWLFESQATQYKEAKLNGVGYRIVEELRTRHNPFAAAVLV
jgi:hypothetical protein